jgi:hypothetical protein
MEISDMQFFTVDNYSLLNNECKMINVMKNIIKISKKYF